jgi:hypothetical protein
MWKNLYIIKVHFKHTKNLSEPLKKEGKTKMKVWKIVSVCVTLGHYVTYYGLQLRRRTMGYSWDII